MVAKRFDIWLVESEPATYARTQTLTPCVIISPDELNRHLETAIVAPITKQLRSYPTRIPFKLDNHSAEIALDQISTIEQSSLIKKLGTLSASTQEALISNLAELFAA